MKNVWDRLIWPGLLCVVIVGILVGIVIVPYPTKTREARARAYATRRYIAEIQATVEAYEKANGMLPDNLEQLITTDGDVPDGMLVTLVRWHSLDDAWGTPFRYTKIDEDTFEIRSAGPDKLMDTDDDIWN